MLKVALSNVFSRKIFATLFISMSLMLSYSSFSYAYGGDFFKQQSPVVHSDASLNVNKLDINTLDGDYRYKNVDMARFIFLIDAKNRKDQLLTSLDRWPEHQDKLINNLTNGQGLERLSSLFSIFVLMLVSGIVVERVASVKMNTFSEQVAEEKGSSFRDNLDYLLMRGIFKYVGICIFAVTAGLISLYHYGDTDPFRLLSLHALALIVKIRALMILLRLILAPYAKGNRLFKINCESASRLYWSTLIFMATYLVITTFWHFLVLLSLDTILFALIIPSTGMILNVLSIAFIWFNRSTIEAMFIDAKETSSAFTRFLRQTWAMIFTIWLFIAWVFWATFEFLGYYEQANHVTPIWWLTFTVPMLDRLIFVILSQLKRTTWLQSHSYEMRCDKFIRRVMIALRILFVAVIFYHIDAGFDHHAWEKFRNSLGGFIQMFVDIIVVIILGYAIWEVIQSAIERHLPYDMVYPSNDNGTSTLDGEGGGTGASRSETLLPLVRSFLLMLLFSCVLLLILNIIGVEIAPLLAGAGIVGIAVGFGAQKLVQDVISGIFFLLDDAFRSGEYIEAASLRGTVERISIRSITLRHHLGAVQTIPFSEIATVRNLSRDWITKKLEFRLDYRTDVEKVRKLIKKVGQKMLLHPEYGQHFILPLKSQGVIRVEESALIFRMKFTCIPGEQWVIRREAFRLVQESLKTNGIEFAHRSVHVLTQNSDKNKEPLKDIIEQKDELVETLGAVAALSVSSEIKKNDKIDSDYD
ncbi:mechanosensitive ion channel family protein [Moritella sp. Urea-trap-13]|uniref:mechanosensitive ion channel family protein n=1 Tax=Moritella sp. Urea-trap-13 TaxID=2058327 RepID=UPI000C32DF4E|nr:mechanosensitive ion channel domain-containing protein [Moritella sp. Urea-trap-13]PKH06172.1 mechanosensitive ion channel family protein [Moritella sp. Urea-trap-13]